MQEQVHSLSVPARGKRKSWDRNQAFRYLTPFCFVVVPLKGRYCRDCTILRP